MKLASDSTINIIRGKNLVGKASKEDVSVLLDHLDAIETILDEKDCEDYFGTEGWRHHFAACARNGE